MRHREFEELVTAYTDYADSDITPKEEKSIREHMEVCTSCRNSYEQEKIIKGKLHRLKEIIPVPPDLDEKLIRSLSKSNTQD
jgi:predicted anti-sigma-YlaC factor YlaD